MARLLVQLKLRLLGNALRGSTAARVSFIVSTIFAALLAVGMFLTLALLRGTDAVDATSLIFTILAFGWLFGPVLVFGLDSTLDPATLALYPLRTRPLAVGLLSASAVGAWPAGNLIGLLGVTVGLAAGALGVLVALIAVLLQLLFCIVLARLVTTSMAGVLRSRRGKDFAVFLVIPIFAVYEFFTQVVPKMAANGKISEKSFAGFDAWMRWLPPGLAAHAIQDASHGRPGPAVARLAALAAIVVVLGWLWVRSLGRALVTADASTQSSRVRGAALPFASGRNGIRATVAARTWIYQRRDPSSLVFWGFITVIMVAVAIKTIIGPQKDPNVMSGVLLGSAAFGAAFTGYFHANTVGLSGPPFVLDALALTGRRQLRAWFSGQNIVLAAIAVPLLTAVQFGLAAAAGHPGDGVPATAVVLTGIGASLGLSNVFTVTLPYPMDKRPGSPMRQAASGHGSSTFGAVLGTLIGTAVLTAPVFVAAALTTHTAAAIRMPVLLVCAAGYGLALSWAGVRLAARAAEDRLPELCQVAVTSKL